MITDFGNISETVLIIMLIIFIIWISAMICMILTYMTLNDINRKLRYHYDEQVKSNELLTKLLEIISKR